MCRKGSAARRTPPPRTARRRSRSGWDTGLPDPPPTAAAEAPGPSTHQRPTTAQAARGRTQCATPAVTMAGRGRVWGVWVSGRGVGVGWVKVGGRTGRRDGGGGGEWLLLLLLLLHTHAQGGHSLCAPAHPVSPPTYSPRGGGWAGVWMCCLRLRVWGVAGCGRAPWERGAGGKSNLNDGGVQGRRPAGVHLHNRGVVHTQVLRLLEQDYGLAAHASWDGRQKQPAR